MNPPQTALITGASSGIGRALAFELAARGFRVGITARRQELLTEVVQEIQKAGGTVAAAVADVGNQEQLITAIETITTALGPVDLAIANAGVGMPSGAGPATIPALEQMVKVNLLGVAYTFAAVVRGMKERKHGHLVAISSLAAYKGLPGSAGYCATKAAVNSYCEAIRIELRKSKIHVTTVCPGFVKTAMTDQNKDPMPFLMDTTAAAKRIANAIERKTKVYSFPWPMKMMLKAAQWAPDWLIAKQLK